MPGEPEGVVLRSRWLASGPYPWVGGGGRVVVMNVACPARQHKNSKTEVISDGRREKEPRAGVVKGSKRTQ